MNTIEAYIVSTPEGVRDTVAEAIRTVRSAAPGAKESISYNMPTFKLANGRPIFLAAWKKHLSLHAVPVSGDALEREVAPLRTAKDTVKFPYNKPIPYDLIGRIVSETARTP